MQVGEEMHVLRWREDQEEAELIVYEFGASFIFGSPPTCMEDLRPKNTLLSRWISATPCNMDSACLVCWVNDSVSEVAFDVWMRSIRS